MSAVRISFVVIGLALAVGCGQDAKPPQTRDAQPPQTPEQLKGRLDAANKVANPSERHDALKVVAIDAADAGVVDVVVKAIEGIAHSGIKDEVAVTCALKLAKRGDAKDATTVAE